MGRPNIPLCLFAVCALSALPLLSQSYQTSFNEVKFDRQTSKRVLHGGPNVDPATGAVDFQLPLGPGIGGKGAELHPTFSFRMSPRVDWNLTSTGSVGRTASGLEANFHPGYYDISPPDGHGGSGFRVSGGPQGSLQATGPAIFSAPNVGQILAAFGYSSSATGSVSVSGNGDLIIPITGTAGEGNLSLPTWVGKDYNGNTISECVSVPQRILVIAAGGDVAYEFRYANAMYPKSPIWPHSCGTNPGAMGQGLAASLGSTEKSAAAPGGGDGDGENRLRQIRYLLSRVSNRFDEQVRISWHTNGVNWSAEWFRQGASTGVSVALSLESFTTTGSSVRAANSWGNASGTARVRLHYTGVNIGDVVIEGVSANAATTYMPSYTTAWGNLLETFQPTRIHFDTTGENIDFTYIGSDPEAARLSSIQTGTRTFNLAWGTYGFPRNASLSDWRGFKIRTLNGSSPNPSSQWGVTSVSAIDPQEPSAPRTTSYTRAVPVVSALGSGDNNNGYIPVWSSTAFHCAVTFPDGSVTLNKYVPPAIGVAGDSSSTVGAQIQTTAHLRHLLWEERQYVAGQDWASDLNTPAESSVAYRVARNGGPDFSISSWDNDRWSTRWVGNSSGSAIFGPNLYPLKKETWQREGSTVVRMESQTVSSSWSAPGGSWTQQTEKIYLNGSLQVQENTDRTFNSDWGLWFVPRESGTTQTHAQDTAAGSAGVSAPSDYSSVSFNPSSNLVAYRQTGAGSGSLKETYSSYTNGRPDSVSLSGMMGSTPLGLSDQAGIDSFQYDSYGHLRLIRSKGVSYSVQQSQDAAGRPTSQKDPNNLETAIAWDGASRLSSVTPPGEQTTNYTYRSLRQVDQTRGSQYTQLNYNGFGELIRVVRLAGNVYSHQLIGYDTRGRKTWQTAWRAGQGVDAGWSKPGSPDDTVTPGYTESVCKKWGPINPETGERDCLNWQTITYPGQTVFRATEHWGYDNRGRVVQYTDANGQVTTTTYDGLSKTVVVAPSTGSARTARYESDVRGRLARVVQNLVKASGTVQIVTAYGYDPKGKLVRVQQTDPETNISQTRSWSFDDLGRLSSTTQPEIGTWNWSSYDVLGKAWSEYRNGRTLSRTYDSQGRLRTVYEGGSRIQELVYDEAAGLQANGKLTTSIDGVIQRFIYGELGGRISRLDTEAAGQVVPQYFSYNSYGQRTHHNVDGRQRIVGFDYERGVPNSVSHWGSNLATAGFDGTSWALTVLSLPNGSTSVFGYDPDQSRLKILTHVWPTGRKDWTYQFDEAGRLTQVLNNGSTEDSYIYDSLNRLIGANTLRPAGGGTLGQAFAYDGFGNMLSNSPSGAYQNIAGSSVNRWDPAVYSQNRLPSSLAAAYDAQGNLVQVDTAGLARNFSYDALGRAVRMTTSGLDERTFYSADTLPVMVEEGPIGSATKRRLNLYDDQRKVVAQYESVGYGTFSWKRDVVHLGGKEVAEVAADGSVKTTLQDHLGSPRFVVSPGGGSFEQKFTAFGERLISDQDAKQFALGFTGHLNGSTGDVIPMQYRNMLARFGRLASPDPGWDQKPEDPQSWNLYVYVRNNPVMMTDPTGEYTLDGAEVKKLRITPGNWGAPESQSQTYQSESAAAVQSALDGDFKGYLSHLGTAWKLALQDPEWLFTAAMATAAPFMIEGPAVRATHVKEMTANGVKFTEESLVMTGKTPRGQVVFLESGNSRAGLQHIVEKHGADFAAKGISEAQIPRAVVGALERGQIVGTNGSASVYRIKIDGTTQYIRVGVSTNGFIVQANPVTKWKPVPIGSMVQ